MEIYIFHPQFMHGMVMLKTLKSLLVKEYSIFKLHKLVMGKIALVL